MTMLHDLASFAERVGVAPPSRSMTLMDRIIAPRPDIALAQNGQQLALTFVPAPSLRGSISVPVEVVDIGHAVLQILPQVLRWLPGDLPHAALLKRETPLARALLLELALLDWISGIESILGTDIRVCETSDFAPEYQIGVRIAGPDFAFGCGMGMDTPLAERLCEILDQTVPVQRTDLPRLPVATTVWMGCQFLSDAEIAALVAGDVIMVEPGPMLALAGDHLAAAIERAPAGLTMVSDFLPRVTPAIFPDLRPLDFVSGHTELPLAQLAELGAGAPFPVAVYGDEAVEIAYGNHVIGRGEAINIGTGRAVRVMHMRPDAISTVQGYDERV